MDVDVRFDERPLSKLITEFQHAEIAGRFLSQRFPNAPRKNWRDLLMRRLLRQARIEAIREVASNVLLQTVFAPPKFLQELIPRQVKDAFGSFAVKSVVIMCVAHLETQFRRMPA